MNLLEIIKVSLNHSVIFFKKSSNRIFSKYSITIWQQNLAGGSITKFTRIFILELHYQKLLTILFENISLNCCTYNKYVFLLITGELQKMLPTYWIPFLKDANLFQYEISITTV